MPVNPCSENGKPGFKWGNSGKCYLYTSGDKKSMNEAKRKATVQGIAIGEYNQKINDSDLASLVKSLRNISKVSNSLSIEEAALRDALLTVAERYGKFDKEDSGIWIEYESAEENDDKTIGVHCKNCALYAGNGVCKILSMEVEDYGKCRFALIPDGLAMPENEMESESEMEDEEEDDSDAMSMLIALIRDILNIQGEKK